MNNKINPWMISTIFLLGLTIGFGIGLATGKLNPATANTAVAAGAVAPTTLGPQPPAAPAPTPTFQPTSTISYDQIDRSVDTQNHWSIGNKNAKVKIQEFSDFQCPFCHRYFTTTFPQLFNDYIATGKVYYTYYNYPLDFHPQAPKAAEAALCAGDQNKYWEFHDLLFANQDVWAFQDATYMQTFQTIATTVGLDVNKFNDCLKTGKFTATVQKDLKTGQGKAVSGTPTFFINKQKVVGAQDYSAFQTAIETELK